MKWSYKLGRIAGIDARVHVTFALVLAWVAWASWSQTGSLLGIVAGLLFVLAIFGSVLLHELGHALTARRFGIETRNITLLPIGGVAQLESNPTTPRAEFWIAIAGPAVNVVLATMLGGLYAASHALGAPGIVDTILGGLALANLGLALFNMIPALPMDGGRVFRAALETRLGKLKATDIATKVARVAAVGMGIAGLFWNPMLLIIAPLVWMMSGRELAYAQMQSRYGQMRGRMPFSRRKVPGWARREEKPSEVQVIDDPYGRRVIIKYYH